MRKTGEWTLKESTNLIPDGFRRDTFRSKTRAGPGTEKKMEMKRITKVIPGDDFTLILLFASEEVRWVDMKPFISGEDEWSELRDPELFPAVKVQDKFGGLEWANGLSYCPISAFMASADPPLWLLTELFDLYADKKKDERKAG